MCATARAWAQMAGRTRTRLPALRNARKGNLNQIVYPPKFSTKLYVLHVFFSTSLLKKTTVPFFTLTLTVCVRGLSSSVSENSLSRSRSHSTRNGSIAGNKQTPPQLKSSPSFTFGWSNSGNTPSSHRPAHKALGPIRGERALCC